MESIDKIMGDIEELLNPKIHIKLEIEVLGHEECAKTAIPLELLKEVEDPKALVVSVVGKMFSGVVQNLKAVIKATVDEMEE